jgi:hypothetical protein
LNEKFGERRKNKEDGLGDRLDADAEDEDFGPEEEEEEFEIDDGRRLEVGVGVRGEDIEAERRIVEPEEGQQIPEIHLEVEVEANVVEEVRRNENENENENEARMEGEVEVGEIINIADDEGDNAGGIGDFLA